jgi:hypothetical protein
MAKKAKTKTSKVKRRAKADRPAKVKRPTKAKRLTKAKRSTTARGEMKIVAVAGAKLKEPGSKGRAHYDKMIGKKVGAYLDRFGSGKPRKTAAQWLANFLREGLVRLR